MKIEIDNKKLYLLYENDPEKERMYSFLKKVVDEQRPLDVGIIDLSMNKDSFGNPIIWIGIYLMIISEAIIETPDFVLDIIPKTEEDNDKLKEFLSNFQSGEDFNRVVISPISKGGICIWTE